MARRRRPALALGIALVLSTLLASSAHAQFRAQSGPCVAEWSPVETLRGPTAILNGAITPLRATIGGLHFATMICATTRGCRPWAPAWFLWSVGWGVGQGAWYVFTGALDTVTGGIRPFSHQKATHLLDPPRVPFLVNDLPEGACSRRRAMSRRAGVVLPPP